MGQTNSGAHPKWARAWIFRQARAIYGPNLRNDCPRLQVLAPVNATFAGLSLEGLHETETSRIAGREALRAGLNLGQHRAATCGDADGQTKRR